MIALINISNQLKPELSTFKNVKQKGFKSTVKKRKDECLRKKSFKGWVRQVRLLNKASSEKVLEV